ncbi:MAG TPA: aldo/keto reductase [Longilinea sp.]|nr:aldo/keto reductase [Longilinea sp.]
MENVNSELHPIFAGIEMGLGTWAWGDRMYWGFGRGYTEEDISQAFSISLQNGIRLLDTAEVYGLGRSEEIVGGLIHNSNKPVVIATKFMPFPWRLNRRALTRALKASLTRLGVAKVDLYQMHQPLPPITIETWMDAMVEAFQNGLTNAVGVSNYDLGQMQRATESLAREGIRLASNQVEYHLLDRRVEKNGLLKKCHEQGVALISYSPLASGVLTGKYTPQNPPQGLRGSRYNAKVLERVQPLIESLKRIGSTRGGKSAAQVALNWCICKGTIPIPGAKTLTQAEMNAGALGWRLTGDEVSLLDEMSEKVTKEN